MTTARGSMSLRARMLGLAVVVTALIVGIASFVEERMVERAFAAEILEAAGATALGVAAEIEESGSVPDSQGLDDLLVQFARAEPSLQDLTLVEKHDGVTVVRTTTDDRLPPAAIDSGRLALESGTLSTTGEGAMHYVAAPLGRGKTVRRALVVSVSTESISRLRRQTRVLALAFGAATILAVVVLMGTLARRYVSALEEQKRQLVEANQRLFGARRELAGMEQLAVAGRMAASVAHQIGTPLNLISGHVQLMLAAAEPGPSPAPSRLRIVQEQIGRVTAIVQNLLDQARRPEPVRDPVDPRALIRGVVELARPTLDSRRIRFDIAVPDDVQPIAGEDTELEQVFLNLIANAIDAMPDGGVLTLRVTASGANVVFQVADTGTGIVASDMARVFDPLFTTKAPGKGTGLGLAIVQEVVRSHGGTVDVRSAPGMGTTFVVTLPVFSSPGESDA